MTDAVQTFAPNMATFFKEIRPLFVGGKLNETQVNGINSLISIYGKDYARSISYPQFAYCFATAFHETAEAMVPVKEKGSTKYFTRLYDITGSHASKARSLGNVHPGDGVTFCGRGYTQVTGRDNYRKVTKLVHELLPDETVDFEANPSALLGLQYGGIVLYETMLRGIFTGKKLSDYIKLVYSEDAIRNKQMLADFIAARRIINGQDRAAEIAGYAVWALAALDKATA